MTNNTINTTTKDTPKTPFASSLYMEHANKTYPANIDILTLESELDCLSLVIKHITRLPGTKRMLGIFPEPNEDVKARCVFKLNIDEVQMLITKLQEFVNAYNEFHKFNFVVGEHTSLEPWEYDVDCDIKHFGEVASKMTEPKYIAFDHIEQAPKPKKPITVNGIQYSSIKEAPIDKLINMVTKDLEDIGIAYTEMFDEGED